MVMLPAHFVHCPDCGRLITVDGLNPSGQCTRDCEFAAYQAARAETEQQPGD